MNGTPVLHGSPEEIRTSAAHWSSFGQMSAAAAADIRAISTDEFVGDEGDTYRSRVSRDLLPQLDACHDAWTRVGTALRTYAGVLESLQQRMAALAQQITDQQSAVAAAHTQVGQATRAASAETARNQAANTPAAPLAGSSTGVADTLVAGGNSTGSALTAAPAAVRRERAELLALHSAADRIRAEHRDAVAACCHAIDAAGELYFAAPPGFLDRLSEAVSQGWSGLCQAVDDWMDTVDWSAISGVLGMVAAVAGVLAMIPVLTPIMAPIALVAGAGALVTSAIGMYASGNWDLGELGLQALGIIPGIRPALSAIRGIAAVARAAPAATAAASAAATAATTASRVTPAAVDLAWDMATLGSQLGTVAITGYQVSTGQASVADLAVAGLGVNVGAIGNMPRAERFQDLLEAAAGYTNESVQIAATVHQGNMPTLGDWTDLIASGGGLVGHAGHVTAHWNGSSGPTGPTRPGASPEYTFADTLAAQDRFNESAGNAIMAAGDVVARPTEMANDSIRRLLYGTST